MGRSKTNLPNLPHPPLGSHQRTFVTAWGCWESRGAARHWHAHHAVLDLQGEGTETHEGDSRRAASPGDTPPTAARASAP
jgi:hypothetical protein